MKKFWILLSALAVISTPFFADEAKTEVVQSKVITFESNKDLVEFTRASMEEGELNSFLKEMDQEYKAGVEDHELEGLVAFLKQTGKYAKISSENTKAKRIEQNKKLLALVENEEETLFVEKIRSSASDLKPEVAAAFETLTLLQMKEPGTGNNADENNVIDLCLEHLFKTLHVNGKDFDNKQQKQVALELDFFKKLDAASQTFSDEALKNQMTLVVAHSDLYIIKMRDTVDVASLHKGIVKPRNDLEQKAIAILKE
jgi:hypothetical protein